MYRKRLRSLAGCMRCKDRHSKCDEKRPRCTFCARHDLKCTWPKPPQPRQKPDSQLSLNTSSGSSILLKEPRRVTNTSYLDPFHTMPVHYSEDFGVIMDHLHNFFIGIMQTVFPFDTADSHKELAHGWLALVYTDEAVCTSFVTYCSWFYTQRGAGQCNLITLSLKNEARSLALLRDRVAKDEAVTEGTLLAAALHLFIAIFGTNDATQLSRIAHGVYAMVTVKGGSEGIIRHVSSSTMQSLMLVDVFNSLLNAEQPFLENIGLFPKPTSYDSLFTGSAIDEVIATCLGKDLTNVLEDMRLVVFFRAPSQQHRKLSSEESRYLFMLVQKISYALCTQQSRLVSSRSVPEIAIYGMILVKEFVLPDVVERPIVSFTILQRLRSAIFIDGSSLRGPGLTVALWASLMTLVDTELEVDKTWALEFITIKLTDRYGRLWPQDWIVQLRRELKRILWHDRIEVTFKAMCTRVCHLRTHFVDHLVASQDGQPVRASRQITTARSGAPRELASNPRVEIGDFEGGATNETVFTKPSSVCSSTGTGPYQIEELMPKAEARVRSHDEGVLITAVTSLTDGSIEIFEQQEPEPGTQYVRSYL